MTLATTLDPPTMAICVGALFTLIAVSAWPAIKHRFLEFPNLRDLGQTVGESAYDWETDGE